MVYVTVKGFQQIAAGAFLDIKPPSGEEWIIHNIRYEGPIELYITTNSTDQFKYDFDNSGGAMLCRGDHLKPDYYIRVKNTDSVARKITFDGCQSNVQEG